MPKRDPDLLIEDMLTAAPDRAQATADHLRIIGQDDGLFKVPDDFDAPLPDEVLALFQS